MYDGWVSILSLIFSVFAIVLVFITKGMSFTLGFRESAATSKKKKEIKSSLIKELEDGVKTFLEKHHGKKKVDEEIMDEITDLAEKVDFTSLGDDLLENMTYYGNLFVKQILLALMYTVLLTCYTMLYWDIFNEVVVILLLFFVIGLIVSLGYMAFKNFRKYYCLRENFQRLYENPTLDFCVVITEDLEAKKVRL